MKLLIVGAGEMGRWLAATVEADVAFADTDPDAAHDAAALLDARAVDVDTDETFDAVCLAVPMSVTEVAVAEHAPRARTALFDVTGVMEAPLAAMADHAADRERFSLHPLFAAENAPGNVALVADAPGDVLDTVVDDIAAAGNEVFETTAAEHDTAMETVQAGAHAAVLAYALAAEPVRDEFSTPVSAGMADLVETVTGGNPRVYREIQETFSGAERVADAARRLAEADGATFDDLYGDAGTRSQTTGERGTRSDE
ncbi:MAG: prephenate dehydrogenase/arogenate dehydrogenase family protein [Halobacteriota archaeon]